MKTAKTIISLLIIALASTSSAQWNDLKDLLFNTQDHPSTIAYTEARDEFMVRERVVTGGGAASAYYANSTELIYEKELDMESWMTEGFQQEEEALVLETWMCEAFGSGSEEELCLEAWMCLPFASSEHQMLDPNMVAAAGK